MQEIYAIELLNSQIQNLRKLPFFIQIIPKIDFQDIKDNHVTFLKEIYAIFLKYIEAMDAVKLKEGLAISMEISSACNKYL